MYAKHCRQGHQKVLYAMEAATQNQHRHAYRDNWHRQVTGNAEQLEPCGYTCELRAGRAEVRQYEHDQGCTAIARSVPVADKSHQTLPCHHTHPRSEAVKGDQCGGRYQQYPQQLIAVLGTEDGVDRDPGRIVVGQTSEKTGTYNGQQCD
jgi:hypothetical protein